MRIEGDFNLDILAGHGGCREARVRG